MGPSMELRDYFAGQAVVPLLAIYERPDFSYTVTKKETAHRAYEMADAMIEIRASKSAELAATVPGVPAANNRSDEIADMLEGAIKLVAQERWEGAGALIGQAIRQLRASA